MKIGIVGPADRAVAWEEHLRPHRLVSEVTIVPKLSSVGEVDACLLLDESKDRLKTVLSAVKQGYHAFLIAPLLTDTRQVEQVYHAAEEANVQLQFSHWPTLAPASKWMNKKVAKPTFIQITRELNYSNYLESGHPFDYYWVDELAFCLRWINGAVHHIDLRTVELSKDHIYALHMLLRFDSGATANIYVNTASATNNHHRHAADNNFLLDCDVLKQTVRLGEEDQNQNLHFSRQSFDATKSAGLAALEFIKSIQLNRPTIYNGFHLLELSKTMDKINNRLARA